MDAVAVMKALREIRDASEKQGIGAALRVAREKHALAPNEPRLLAVLAENLLWTGDIEGASKAIDDALAINPDCAEAHAQRASLASFCGDLHIAQRAYERACQLSPGTPETLLAGMNYHTIRKAPDYSLECARAWFALDEHSPQAWSALISALFECGESEEAVAMVDSASPRMRQFGTYHLWRSRLCLLNRDLIGSEKASREAVKATPESDGAWTALAQSLEFQGKIELAVEAARKAIAINSRNAVALRCLAGAATAQGDDEGAREFNRLADDAVPALAYYGKLYPVLELVSEGLMEEALELALDAEDGAPEGLRVSLNGTILFILQELQRWDEIEERLVAMRAFGDINADYYDFLSGLHLHREEESDALRVAAEGHRRFPESAELFARWVTCLVATGDLETLGTVAQELVKSPPNSPASCTALVDALDASGMREAAKGLLFASLEKFPESTELLGMSFAFALEEGALGDWFADEDAA